MPSRFANGLTLLSAVVCVGSAMLVGRSYYRADLVGVPLGQRLSCGAVTINAQLLLWREPNYGTFVYTSQGREDWRGFFSRFWRSSRGIRWLGVGWSQRFLILPLWLLPLLTAIAPVRWGRRRRREAGRGFPVAAA